MAIYYSTLIQSEVIDGNTNIEVIQETISMKTLINSFGTEKLFLRSLDIWSDNRSQIPQPLKFVKKKVDGGFEDYFTKVPQLDSFQKENLLNNYDLGGLEFDENTNFQYELLANTKLKLTLNFDEEARNALSQVSTLGINPDEKLESLIHPEILEEKTIPVELIEPVSDTSEIKTAVPKKEEKKPGKKTDFWWIIALAITFEVILNHDKN